MKKTPYELYKRRKPSISHFHVFGSICYILNNGKESLGKFDAKIDEEIFVGYLSQSKGYRVFNKRTLVVEETIQVIVDDVSIGVSNPREDSENDVIQNLERLSIDQNESNTQDNDPFERRTRVSSRKRTNFSKRKEICQRK